MEMDNGKMEFAKQGGVHVRSTEITKMELNVARLQKGGAFTVVLWRLCLVATSAFST